MTVSDKPKVDVKAEIASLESQAEEAEKQFARGREEELHRWWAGVCSAHAEMERDDRERTRTALISSDPRWWELFDSPLWREIERQWEGGEASHESTDIAMNRVAGAMRRMEKLPPARVVTLEDIREEMSESDSRAANEIAETANRRWGKAASETTDCPATGDTAVEAVDPKDGWTRDTEGAAVSLVPNEDELEALRFLAKDKRKNAESRPKKIEITTELGLPAKSLDRLSHFRWRGQRVVDGKGGPGGGLQATDHLLAWHEIDDKYIA